jgi:hypothetical protein
LPDGAVRSEQELDQQIALGHTPIPAEKFAVLEAAETFDRVHQLL